MVSIVCYFSPSNQISPRQLKGGHMISPQQHVCNGLARPARRADESILSRNGHCESIIPPLHSLQRHKMVSGVRYLLNWKRNPLQKQA